MKRMRIVLLIILLILGNISFALAAEAEEPQAAPVMLGDKILFQMRAGTKAFTPQLRADQIAARIKELADDYLFRPETISTEDLEFTTEISGSGRFIMAIFEADGKAAGRDRNELAREYVGIIKRAIEEYRTERSTGEILKGLALTLVASSVLIVLVYLLSRLFQRIRQAVWESARIPSVRLGTFEFFTASRIKVLIVGLARLGRLGLLVLLILTYLNLGLSFFPWTRAISQHLLGYVKATLVTMGYAILDQIPGLTFIAILFLITRYVLKTLRFFFHQVKAGKVTIGDLDAEIAEPTYKIVRLLIIALAMVVAYPYIPGSESPAFKGLSIFAGVIFSLGSSSAIAGMTAGFSLIYMRAFKEGDVVKVGDTTGIVLERRLMVTRLKTFKNEEITIPSSNILAGQVTNYSLEAKTQGLILHTSVTIGYDAPWRTVHELLIQAAKSTSHVLESPVPFVLQTALNDFYVSYQLNVATDAPHIMPRIYSELHQNIQDEFNAAGVEIMSSHYTQIRDGNQTTIPQDYLSEDYHPPSIRIVETGSSTSAGSRKTETES
jgi:small-conductance mechanosensitive channel